MKLRLRDVITHQGRDWTVQGILTYRLDAQTLRLVRVVDGSRGTEEVRWVEPLTSDMDDRILLLAEVTDLRIGAPPPPTISYQGGSYLPRLSGRASITVEGDVGGRAGGVCELWRYRAAGDVFIQVEKWSDRVVVLAGESVHKDMIELFPAP